MHLFEIENSPLFLAILPIVAFMYAAVGHGGASGYLALMALFSFAPNHMKPIALLLNLFVAGIAFFNYFKKGFFKLKLFLYFSITSIPFAYLGGTIELDANIYKKTLAVILLFSVVRLLKPSSKNEVKKTDINPYIALLLGALVGLFSGVIGIGGGIILSPLILILGWGNVRETAAVSALFIWVNSAAGLFGQYTKTSLDFLPSHWFLILLVLIGGWMGSYYGSEKFNNKHLKYLLSFVLVLASFKLFFA